MTDHIEQTVVVCNQRFTYLPCQLKSQILPLEYLDRTFDANVVSKLMLVLPSWSGYTNVEQFSAIRKLFAKA